MNPLLPSAIVDQRGNLLVLLLLFSEEEREREGALTQPSDPSDGLLAECKLMDSN